MNNRESYLIELYIRESGLHVFLSLMGPVFDDPVKCSKWVGRNFPQWLAYETEHEGEVWALHKAKMAAIEARYQWGLNVAHAEGG